MARLQGNSGEGLLLLPHHVIGRSRAADTVLAEADVSSQHLAIVWDGQRWSARDLGSRNGTWLDGRRLDPGERAPLKRGSALQVGGPTVRFTLVDDAPPAPVARSGDRLIEGQAELLALPSPEDPAAVVMLDLEEGWVLSANEQVRPIADGHVLDLAGERWQISLPVAVDRTAEAGARQAGPDVELNFRVSADEEYVELDVVLGASQHALPPRAHHYILLTLARARLKDAKLPESEQGWVYGERLLRMLRVNSNQLYISLHRARKEFDAFGLPASWQLIERRSTTRQLRLGPRALRVQAL